MKKQLNVLLSELRAEQLDKLTTIVKETIVTRLDLPKSKRFTSADMWNIQRQYKNRMQRRIFA